MLPYLVLHPLASRCDHFYLWDPFIITSHDARQFAGLAQNCVSSVVSKIGSTLDNKKITYVPGEKQHVLLEEHELAWLGDDLGH